MAQSSSFLKEKEKEKKRDIGPFFALKGKTSAQTLDANNTKTPLFNQCHVLHAVDHRMATPAGCV